MKLCCELTWLLLCCWSKQAFFLHMVLTALYTVCVLCFTDYPTCSCWSKSYWKYRDHFHIMSLIQTLCQVCAHLDTNRDLSGRWDDPLLHTLHTITWSDLSSLSGYKCVLHYSMITIMKTLSGIVVLCVSTPASELREEKRSHAQHRGLQHSPRLPLLPPGAI